MTDKELLEAAARAVGLEHRGYVDDFYDPEMNVSIGLMYGCPTCVWNPLTNDGDAFRLAVDLGLAVHCDEEGAQVWHSHDVCGSYGFAECDVSDSCDKKQAVRRAIVMSAVEIGKCK